jgi:hypothetical protein
MAATIAIAYGEDQNRTKEAHRLGSRSATGEANTWRTFTTAHVRPDGSGWVRVVRDGRTIHAHDFGPEDGTEE